MPDPKQDTLDPRPALPQEAPGTPGAMPLPARVPPEPRGDGTSVAGVRDEPTPERPPGPTKMAWRRFRRHRPGMVGLGILIVLYFIVIFADFIAPYHYA